MIMSYTSTIYPPPLLLHGGSGTALLGKASCEGRSDFISCQTVAFISTVLKLLVLLPESY
jgi:hypothetical protein